MRQFECRRIPSWARLGVVGVMLVGGLAGGAAEADVRREVELLKQRILELERKLAEGDGEGKALRQQSGEEQDIDAEFLPGAARGHSWADRTSLGGYGEMHLTLGDTREIDFHRWVLFLGHEFTDRVRLVSEVELEHSIAGEGKDGEIEVEQAYVDFSVGKGVHLKGGLFLLPLGILNETHEPTAFFGTERNPVEREIIPTTWWEGGLGVNQIMSSGLQWDVAFHSGLAVDPANFRLRGGRQKVSEADASEWAATARVRYTGVPGLEVGGSAQYQSDITPGGLAENNDAVLGEAHFDIRKSGFGLRGLAAYWSIDGATPEAMGLDEQWGFYLEPSYTVTFEHCGRLGVFGRYNRFDAAVGQIEQWDVGLNYWPVENVVLKTDFSHVDQRGADPENLYNLGLGYRF